MTWVNEHESRLYVVKRKFAEEYHTGNSKAGNKPQLYAIGHAKSARNQLNKWLTKEDAYSSLEDYRDKHSHWRSNPYIKDFDEWCESGYKAHLDDIAKGPWVVAVMQFTATEIEE